MGAGPEACGRPPSSARCPPGRGASAPPVTGLHEDWPHVISTSRGHRAVTAPGTGPRGAHRAGRTAPTRGLARTCGSGRHAEEGKHTPQQTHERPQHPDPSRPESTHRRRPSAGTLRGTFSNSQRRLRHSCRRHAAAERASERTKGTTGKASLAPVTHVLRTCLRNGDVSAQVIAY